MRSEADYAERRARFEVAKAKRPKVPVTDAQAALARATAHCEQCRAQVAEVLAANSGDDRVAARQAARKEQEVVDALLDSEVALEVAQQTLQDSERRERGQRDPLFELKAIALARQLDQKLNDPELAAIISSMVELAEQSQAAGGRVDVIFPGLLPERIEFWRDEQKKCKRLS